MNKKFLFILALFPLIFLSVASSRSADDQSDWTVVGKKSGKGKKKVDHENLDGAKEFAKNIIAKDFKLGIDNVMNSHSKTNHKSTDSYFYLDDREGIKKLIMETCNNPNNFSFREVARRDGKKNTRLSISKTFEHPIGHDERDGATLYRLVACFDVSNGVFLTAFPAKENYDMSCK